MRAFPGMLRRLARRSLHVLSPLVISCVLVSGASARHHGHAARQDAVPGQFDYYLLALSWSPAYCLLHPGDQQQCGRSGLGFVLHGLWPQFDSGGFPENCASDATLDPSLVALGARIYPSPALVRHEWQAHGTCSGLDPAQYFRTADRALAAVRVPQALSTPERDLQLTAAQIISAFRETNPSLPEDGIAVECSRNELSEVRVCLSRDLSVRSCGRRVRSHCTSGPILVRSHS